MKTIDIIIISLLVIVAIFAMWLDRQDWECPDLYASRSECKTGKGRPISNTEPVKGDNNCTSLDKIAKAAKAESGNVKWRQSAYLSIFGSIAIYGLVATPGELPEWPVLYASAIILFAILYMNFNWYSYHRYRDVEKNIRGNVAQLRKSSNCQKD